MYLDLLAHCIAHFVEVTLVLCLRYKILLEDFDGLRMSRAKGIKGKDVGPSDTMSGNQREGFQPNRVTY